MDRKQYSFMWILLKTVIPTCFCVHFLMKARRKAQFGTHVLSEPSCGFVCVCVCVHVYVVYEDTHFYNDMGMTGITRRR